MKSHKEIIRTTWHTHLIVIPDVAFRLRQQSAPIRAHAAIVQLMKSVWDAQQLHDAGRDLCRPSSSSLQFLNIGINVRSAFEAAAGNKETTSRLCSRSISLHRNGSYNPLTSNKIEKLYVEESLNKKTTGRRHGSGPNLAVLQHPDDVGISVTAPCCVLISLAKGS